MWIGIDDTDSRNGGCTTYVAYELIRELINKKYCIIGYPRLIRLNPQVPWKTRGNGAIAIHVQKKTSGLKTVFGYNNNKELTMNMTYGASENSYDEIIPLVRNTIEHYAEIDEEQTNPAFVILSNPISDNFYLKAVHELVNKEEAIQEIKKADGYYELYKNGRGVIGATAAISWSPTRDKTYELITYREKKRWGSKRDIDKSSVIAIDKSSKTTFDNYDYINDYVSIGPNSPCPILYGIRGEIPEELPSCQQHIDSEPFQGWMIYETNQGTDDHLRKTTIRDIEISTSVIVSGTVSKNPSRNLGGHVIFTISDDLGNSIDCAAYEPTKNFRDTIELLHSGDYLTVYGGIRDEPRSINIEKIKISSLTDITEKIENPICPQCKKHMKSKGKNQGYKCKTCKTIEKDPIVKKKKRNLETIFYEVPVCARRHLSKPLQRM